MDRQYDDHCIVWNRWDRQRYRITEIFEGQLICRKELPYRNWGYVAMWPSDTLRRDGSDDISDRWMYLNGQRPDYLE